mmetsp:Transcript_22412/g.44436  ORF Transcript_22412/g.44436 Transcript_22412/m.44436 type:complete len:897 (-) Transcript_22412:227-2917(-)
MVVLNIDVEVSRKKSTGVVTFYDSAIKSQSQLVPGAIVSVKVKEVAGNFVKISFAAKSYSLHGRIHASQILDPTSKKDIKSPLAVMAEKSGQMIKAKVMNVLHKKKEHKTSTWVELSAAPSAVKVEGTITEASLESLAARVGKSIIGYVVNVVAEEACVWIELTSSIKGRMNAVDISDDLNVLRHLSDHYQPGQAVLCTILSVDPSKGFVNLGIKAKSSKATKVEAGAQLTAQIISVVPSKGLKVKFAGGVFGHVHVCDLSDGWSMDPFKKFTVGKAIKVKVLYVDKQTSAAACTLRSPSKPREQDTIHQLKAGQVVQGYVVAISSKGCWVALSNSVTAKVMIKDLSDRFVKEPAKDFPVGRLVTGKVLAVHVKAGKVDLSLRTSTMDTNSNQVQFKDLKEGAVITGRVTNVTPVGVFIQIQQSSLKGLCHKSQVSDSFVRDMESHYKVSDLVKAVILKLDPLQKRISFGLKASLFKEGELVAEEDDEDEKKDQPDSDEGDDEGDEGDEGDDVSDEDFHMSGVKGGDQMEDDDEGDEGDEDSSDERNTGENSDSDAEVPDLASVVAAQPATQIAESDDEDDEDDEDGDISKGKSRKAKAAAKKRSERVVAEREEAYLSGEAVPETAEDFERMLVTSPNSSYIWIQYIAYQVSLTEIGKARAIAERALKNIVFREEQEKFNVWIAYLNLENMYGSEDSVVAVMNRAIQYNDKKKIWMEVAKMFAGTGKNDAAVELYEKVIKKFGHTTSPYLSFAIYHFKDGRLEAARSLLDRALKRTEKRKHIKLISNFAQLEFRHGSPDRGRTILEGMLSNYPKRLDLWSLYLDMESKHLKQHEGGDLTAIRRLYDRVCHMNFKVRQMRFLFKRYLAFEKEHGNDETTHKVKQLAQAWVNQQKDKM